MTPSGWSRLAGLAAVALAIAWLPGQTQAGALRHWIAVGALPLLIALRGPALPRTLWPWAALVALTAISALWAPWPGAALDVALTQLGWLAAALLGNRCDSDELAPWVSLAGALGVGMAWSFGNPDYAVAWLVGTVPWTGWALWRGPSKRVRGWVRGLHGLSLLAQLGALAFFNSLGAWAALVLAAGLLGLQAGGRWRLAAVGLLLAGAVACLHPTVHEHVTGRLHLAKIAFEIGQLEPLTGTGPGAFHGAFLEGQATVDAGDRWTNATHAHNEPLQVWAEQGLPGLLLLLAPLALVLGRPQRSPAWAGVVIYATVGLVSLPLYMPGGAWLAGLCLGAATRGPASTGPWPRRLGLAIAVPALLLASANLLSDRLLRRADTAEDPRLAAQAGTLALRPARALRVEARALMPTDLAAAAAAAAAANQRAVSVEGHMLVGQVAMAAGQPAQAALAYEQAVRLCPRLFAGWFDLALAHRGAGQHGAARRAAARARALRPSDPRTQHLP